jgi:Abortive infection alpha
VEADVAQEWDGSAQHRPRPVAAPLVDGVAEPVSPNESAARSSGRNARRQGTQMVAAVAGGAGVAAVRVGWFLGRSGLRAARRVPVVDAVEQRAQRLRHAAAAQLLKLLEIPPGALPPAPGRDEHRPVTQDLSADLDPLRTAMTELLDRATDPDRARSRDYLFATLVNQLVPDEARILAQLATGGTYAVVDVVAKQLGRSPSRTVLSNVSTIGIAAGISVPANTPTYVTRLHTLGLIDIEPAGDAVDQLADQFDRLGANPDVRRARGEIDRSRGGSAKVVRQTLRLSSLGREFWTACAPSGTTLARRSG